MSVTKEVDLDILVSSTLRTGPVANYQGPYSELKIGGYQIGDTVLADDNFIYICIFPTLDSPIISPNWRRFGGMSLSGQCRLVTVDFAGAFPAMLVNYQSGVVVTPGIPPELSIVRNPDIGGDQIYTVTLDDPLTSLRFRGIGGGGGGGSGATFGGGGGGSGGTGAINNNFPWYPFVSEGNKGSGTVYTLRIGRGGPALTAGNATTVSNITPTVIFSAPGGAAGASGSGTSAGLGGNGGVGGGGGGGSAIVIGNNGGSGLGGLGGSGATGSGGGGGGGGGIYSGGQNNGAVPGRVGQGGFGGGGGTAGQGGQGGVYPLYTAVGIPVPTNFNTWPGRGGTGGAAPALPGAAGLGGRVIMEYSF